MELVLLGSLLCYGFTEKRLLPARSPANVAGPYATKEPFLLALTHGESNFRQNFPFFPFVFEVAVLQKDHVRMHLCSTRTSRTGFQGHGMDKEEARKLILSARD